MTPEVDDEGFNLTTIKRVQVVGMDEINDKLLNGWLLLRIIIKRVDEADIPGFIIGRQAAEIPKTSQP